MRGQQENIEEHQDDDSLPSCVEFAVAAFSILSLSGCPLLNKHMRTAIDRQPRCTTTDISKRLQNHPHTHLHLLTFVTLSLFPVLCACLFGPTGPLTALPALPLLPSSIFHQEQKQRSKQSIHLTRNPSVNTRTHDDTLMVQKQIQSLSQQQKTYPSCEQVTGCDRDPKYIPHETNGSATTH